MVTRSKYRIFFLKLVKKEKFVTYNLSPEPRAQLPRVPLILSRHRSSEAEAVKSIFERYSTANFAKPFVGNYTVYLNVGRAWSTTTRRRIRVAERILESIENETRLRANGIGFPRCTFFVNAARSVQPSVTLVTTTNGAIIISVFSVSRGATF